MIFMDHGTVDENNITLLMVLYWDIPGYYLQYVLLSLYMGVRRGGGGGGGGDGFELPPPQSKVILPLPLKA